MYFFPIPLLFHICTHSPVFLTEGVCIHAEMGKEKFVALKDFIWFKFTFDFAFHINLDDTYVNFKRLSSFKKHIKCHFLGQVFSNYPNESNHSKIIICVIFITVWYVFLFIHLLFIVYLLPTNDKLHDGGDCICIIYYLKTSWNIVGAQ